MAYDHELADRVRALIGGRADEEKRMFGGLAFLVNGHLSVAASGQGGLLARCEPEQTEALLGEPGVEEFSMRGRNPMRGWLRVSGDAVNTDDALAAWIDRGVSYARSLPAKKGR